MAQAALIEAPPRTLDLRHSPKLVRGERRQSPRLGLDQLPWLKRVSLDITPTVALIDLSVHGALIEIDIPARPGRQAQFELHGDDRRAVVSGQVLRTEVSTLHDRAIRYRSACAFAEPLPWKHRLTGPPQPPPRINVPPPYAPSETWSQIRVTLLHGKILQGFVCRFEPGRASVELWPSCRAEGRPQTIPLALIRKLMFVRAFEADGAAREILPAPVPCLQPVEVEFRNNEVAAGSTLGYDEADGGLWVFDPDAPAMFAVASAVRQIRFF